jgi:hypothetical protein
MRSSLEAERHVLTGRMGQQSVLNCKGVADRAILLLECRPWNVVLSVHEEIKEIT